MTAIEDFIYNERLKTALKMIDVENDVILRLREISKTLTNDSKTLIPDLGIKDSVYVHGFITKTKEHLRNNLKVIDDLRLCKEDMIRMKEGLRKSMKKNLKFAEMMLNNLSKEKVIFT